MGKIKQWIVAHKVWSIVIASVLVVSITLSISLPLALRHKHTYSKDWSADATYHWHECTGKKCDKTKGKEEHTFVDKNNDTQYWLECSVCGYQKDLVTATLTDATQYNNAMQFKDAEGNHYKNFDMIVMRGLSESSRTKAYQYTVTETAAYRYSIASDGDLETIWTNENGKGVIYTKHDANSEWVRTEQETEFTDFAACFTSTFVSDVPTKVAFDTISGAYSTDTKVGYYKQYNNYYGNYIFGTITSSYTMKFADGKLVWMDLLKKNDSGNPTGRFDTKVTYGNATIEIPTVNPAE